MVLPRRWLEMWQPDHQASEGSKPIGWRFIEADELSVSLLMARGQSSVDCPAWVEPMLACLCGLEHLAYLLSGLGTVVVCNVHQIWTSTQDMLWTFGGLHPATASFFSGFGLLILTSLFSQSDVKQSLLWVRCSFSLFLSAVEKAEQSNLNNPNTVLSTQSVNFLYCKLDVRRRLSLKKLSLVLLFVT